METEGKPLLTRNEAAEFLNESGYPTTKGSLQKLASVGGGPAYEIFGNKALYKPKNLISWAESRLSRPRTHTNE